MSARRALVTGAASGIGRATAAELTARGFAVVAADLDVAALHDVDAAERVQLDLTDPESVGRCAAAAGDVDVLVNNAGISVSGPVEDVPMSDTRDLFDIFVFGPVRLIQLVLPSMRARGAGTIVNVTSVVVRSPIPLSTNYTAAKAALDAFTEGLAWEAAHFGIRVVAVMPGSVRTNMAANRRRHGLDGAYAPLVEEFARGAGDVFKDSYVEPHALARVIAGAIEDPATPLRVPASDDVVRRMRERASSDDAAYRAATWRTFKLTW